MRFSFWPAPTFAWADTHAQIAHAEQVGFDGAWYADHFMADAEDTSGDWYEAWTTLAALAAKVPRLRLGTLVTGNTYRHPAVLAKMVATIDHMSGGRAVLGLGSGWQENEHRQYGIPFHTVGGRLARLEEACQVIRSLYQNETTTFEGRFYQLEKASLAPKPVQSPLPLLIGGGGEKVTLRIAARYADEWNIWATVDTMVAKMQILDRHCAEVGRDPKEIERSAVALLFMFEDEASVKAMRERKIPRACVIGTPKEVAESMAAYRDAGVQEFIVPGFTLGNTDAAKSALDLFATHVIGQV